MSMVGNQIGTESLVLLADLNEPAVGVSIVVCCLVSVLLFCWPENSWLRFCSWLDGYASRVGRAVLEVCDEPLADPESKELPVWVVESNDGFHEARVFGNRCEVWNGEKLEFVVWSSSSIMSVEDLQQYLDVWFLGQTEGHRQVNEYLQQEFIRASV